MKYEITVDGMHCEKCVSRIENALKETGISFAVSLENKTVTIDGCEHCLKTALSELKDLGFEPIIK